MICRKVKTLSLTSRGIQSSSESEDSEDVNLGSPEKGEAEESESNESPTQLVLSDEVEMTGKDDQSDSTAGAAQRLNKPKVDHRRLDQRR